MSFTKINKQLHKTMKNQQKLSVDKN